VIGYNYLNETIKEIEICPSQILSKNVITNSLKNGIGNFGVGRKWMCVKPCTTANPFISSLQT
jgi:hypothetical protein